MCAASRSIGERKRERLFELYSQNLQYVRQDPLVNVIPDFDEGIICPMCFKLFARDSLSTEWADHLTLEDVPPKSLGGKARTLTCKECNNHAGSQLESHLTKKLQTEEFFKGYPDILLETRFSPHPSIELTATTRLSSDKVIEVVCDPSRSDPQDVGRFADLQASGSIPTFKLRWLPGYRINRAEIALIRIAYLLAFSQFGYGFLMNPNLMPVRHQMQEPETKILPSWGIVRAEFPDESVGISVVQEPKDLRAFLIVFELETENRRTRHGVVLPGPSSPGTAIYPRVSQMQGRTGGAAVQHKLHVVSEADYLTDPRLAFASHTIWHEATL